MRGWKDEKERKKERTKKSRGKVTLYLCKVQQPNNIYQLLWF